MGAADTCSAVIGLVADGVKRCGSRRGRTTVTLTRGTCFEGKTSGRSSHSKGPVFFLAGESFVRFAAFGCRRALIAFERSTKIKNKKASAVQIFQTHFKLAIYFTPIL